MRRTGPPGRDRNGGEGPAARLRENVTEITVLVATGLLLVAGFSGLMWLLPFAIVGYIVVVPLITMLFGNDGEYRALVGESGQRSSADADTAANREPGRTEPRSGSSHRSQTDESDRRDALETLRDRYAAGELTDEQFERKLERLLHTETLEDVADWVEDRSARGRAQDGTSDGADGREGENRTERDYEYES
ncbi:SHOCT domain-containing protein [Halopiger xanaduensis]|uniref:SHOCT domain-containing protein n=1 Tax=Halopiger xanaduensis (strain DSM 18323 / JCM 14033 / SH-6) TaxID=797210 RepID=F8DAU4_HALXS|nr:SHOCT domain-containing protein [Halopiger xanaduensis]AEH37039.1 Protein of unknown function DUF2078, membrane [Halopiger xanaduensis SH-6]